MTCNQLPSVTQANKGLGTHGGVCFLGSEDG